MLPVALYGLEVPPGGILIPAMQEDSFPDAAFRITMAALDPTATPEADEEGNIPAVPRATLKLVRQRSPDLDDELDDEYLQQLMGGGSDSSDDDDEDEEEEEEANGGPSDPSKSKKAKQAAALKKLIAAAKAEDSDEEMADGAETNGKPKKKGKEPATSSDDDDDDESEDSEELDMEDFVVCTLDTERNYQQTLDITIGPNEKVFFVVIGTHTIHLTGNYVIDADEAPDSDKDSEYDSENDFPEALEEMYGQGSESEDDLDGLEDPRIKEIESDEEVPKLVEGKKGKNKRPAEDATEGLDAMIAKADAAGETKLTKKQQKKLKNNKGEPVVVDEKSPKADKKVQFAKNLEQGPTGPAAKGASLGVKVVQDVTIDDRKLGSGRTVKKGDKVGVRYIGKLQDGKVFDSNKKGKPFSFSAGTGQVIKGWDIGIQGMAVGGERRLTIPAKLAYGSKSQPGIPANSTLTFDIKLLEIK
ncbi:uncharacterized protein BCR38DRAFT_339975 [Pseudomassariella vexata]|uniref:FK506-binding protein n=1 Tax=Pseudomassariella vexata TaxID=1141098 RepID=A0A1Y2E2W8_9PEZI|nr:uncharacterized protein BCR38DRAFT_339975 [Pseudomassariella vexata]ORY65872.1 hypothetical protein BCR38DRAFT_339975 [Pseudomassariella vexata]